MSILPALQSALLSSSHQLDKRVGGLLLFQDFCEFELKERNHQKKLKRLSCMGTFFVVLLVFFFLSSFSCFFRFSFPLSFVYLLILSPWQMTNSWFIQNGKMSKKLLIWFLRPWTWNLCIWTQSQLLNREDLCNNGYLVFSLVKSYFVWTETANFVGPINLVNIQNKVPHGQWTLWTK